MRSIFARVVLWSLGTFALSLVAYWALSRTLDRKEPGDADPIRGIIEMVEDDLSRAYEEGGSERLAAQLKKLDSYLPGEHLLTDENGRDLITGADRSDLLNAGPPRLADRRISGKQGRNGGRHGGPGPPRLADGRIVLIPPHSDGRRYRFITLIQPWFNPPNILPYYGAVVLVILGMGAVLAMHLAMPLRHLRRVMDRFGRGDLTARAGVTRRDEIGELSRSFDEMAGRIETLLVAERRLLQDVSHELRSPLTRLDVAVELAITSDDPGPSLARIRRDIDRLTVLVNELLQLTRAEGDPAVLDLEEIRMDELSQGLLDDCVLEAQAKGCRLVLHAEEPCSVLGERELLRRAVENVVRNAIRHAPESTPVEVNVENGTDSVRITVRDHGPGVPEELLPNIFEPFFRVEGHRSRSSGGIGLGLAIARRAVALHHGRITARNAAPGLIVAIDLPTTSAGR